MRVWLAEKPSFGEELAKVLGNNTRIPGLRNAWETNQGRVLCAAGHLVTLAEPEDYDPIYKDWSIDHLPIVPKTWQIKEIPEKKEMLDVIARGIRGATEIVIATDAGREGEYIAYLIIKHLGLMKIPKKRLWSSGANAASIAKAVENLLPYHAKYLLAEAAQIRAESDWLEGMNLTRLFTKRFGPEDHRLPISVGRVQTATLAIIVRRQREIRDFKPQQYYELEVNVVADGHSVRLHHRPAEDARITDPARALEMCNRVQNRKAPIVVTSEDRSERPPALFESSSLQIRAYNLWGWPAEHTEKVAQALYDEHKLISYPRTDGVHLEDEQWNDVPIILKNLAETNGIGDIQLRDRERFQELARHIPETPVKRGDVFSSKRLAASGADHHGIIPTVEKPDLSELTPDERKLYALIARQYLAQFHPDCLYKQKRISWTVDDVEFVANGRTITKPGWRVLFGDGDQEAERAESGKEEEPDAVALPPVKNGALGAGTYPQVIQKTTRSPKPFTEGSIISAMRNVLTVAKDPKIREILKGVASIGTKSTWGETVRKLKERRYIDSVKGQLRPTVLGEDLIALCEKHAPNLVHVESTAVLERMLADVEQSRVEPERARQIIQKRNIETIYACLKAPDHKLRTPAGGSVRKTDGKPRPFADFAEGSFIVDIPYGNDAVKELVKGKLGGRFNGETRKWHVAKTPDNEAQLRAHGLMN